MSLLTLTVIFSITGACVGDGVGEGLGVPVGDGAGPQPGVGVPPTGPPRQFGVEVGVGGGDAVGVKHVPFADKEAPPKHEPVGVCVGGDGVGDGMVSTGSNVPGPLVGGFVGIVKEEPEPVAICDQFHWLCTGNPYGLVVGDTFAAPNCSELFDAGMLDSSPALNWL